jgi:UDP-2-acetamido-3-amino-2,3-dideoxy-glucuronate N-acetyltransferase
MAGSIHPTAEVSKDASVGEGTKIWHYAQVREGASIGAGCVLGHSVYVDHGVSIGNGVKIQNGVSVYHGVTIEDDVLIAANVTFTNDKHPRAFIEDWEVTPTLIKKGASIGANATIVCGVTVGEYAMVGAGSVVTKDVPPYGLVIGNPAVVIGEVDKRGERIK